MTIDPSTCSTLDESKAAFECYLTEVVDVAVHPPLSPIPGSGATAVVLFEIIHNDPLCAMAIADACVLVVSRDVDVQFVAPDAPDNYVSYWHEEPAPGADDFHWAVLSGGQRSTTHRVRMLGQTLPPQISAPAAGYLHHQPDRPGNGWTVGVGIFHPGGATKLTDLELGVSVTGRPYWNPETESRAVLLTALLP